MASRRNERLEQLYAQFGSSAFAYAYLLTGDRAAAEDLAHDAFLKATGRLAQLRNPSGFEPYLRRTVLNLFRSQYRRRRVQAAYLDKQRDTPLTGDTSLEQVDDRDQLWRALDALTPRQRVAIVCRYFEDLSEHQTSVRMNCSVGTVKSLTSRGLQTLRDQMRGERDD